MTIFFNDNALLKAFRRGDPAALTKVYLRYVEEVERHVGKHLRGETDLKEIVQEVFAKAFAVRARYAYDGIRRYGAYLQRITTNTIIDFQRKAPRDPLRLAAAAPNRQHTPDLSRTAVDQLTDPAQETVSAEYELHHKRIMRGFNGFYQSLSPDDQQIAELLFLEDQPQEKIAQILDTTRAKVRHRQASLRKRFRKYLIRQGIVTRNETIGF